MITIRLERGADTAARETLLDAAFGPERHLKTCERLREGRLPAIALVAEQAGCVVGTVRLWHVAADAGRRALVLGPLAVDDSLRSQGIGGKLMRAALNLAATCGHAAVLLVGDALYYERFGFSTAPTQGLTLPGPVERERFLGLELKPGALAGAKGIVSAVGELAPAAELEALVAAAAGEAGLVEKAA
jgi:predicted N-acetyltransferase YhbS